MSVLERLWRVWLLCAPTRDSDSRLEYVRFAQASRSPRHFVYARFAVVNAIAFFPRYFDLAGFEKHGWLCRGSFMVVCSFRSE